MTAANSPGGFGRPSTHVWTVEPHVTNASVWWVARLPSYAWALLSICAACLGPSATSCPGGGICPAGLECLFVDDRQLCLPPGCGNGTRDVGEDCDDGNHVDGDGCGADCRDQCGNGRVDFAEACDDGNVVDGDGCSAICDSNETCGNGVIDPGEGCDDHNGRNRDGCSSVCDQEQPTWTQLERSPTPRIGAAMVYDAARGVTVLFGGCDTSTSPCTPLGDTWEWDGLGWVERQKSADPPAPRFGHAMAYDASRGVTVLFGGCIDIGANNPCTLSLDDTWEWNGVRWEQPSVGAATNPGPHAFHAMAYHAGRRRTILVGGDVGGMYIGDMWEWEGQTWSQLPTSPPRHGHALAYDPIHDELVMFGGITLSAEVLDSTLRWNGVSWRSVTSGPRPPARFGHALVYSPSRGRVVAFGGCGSPPFDLQTCSGIVDATWELDGDTWIDRSLSIDRASVAGAVDARGNIVAFGGVSGAVDTLTLAASWQIAAPHPLPPPRWITHLAYDAVRGVITMFSGEGAPGDTWEWNGTWSARDASTRPRGRIDPALVFDPTTSRTMMFGRDLTEPQPMPPPMPQFPDEYQWDWNGTFWAQRHPIEYPDVTSTFASVYVVDGGVFLVGGSLPGGAIASTWRWDGDVWSRVPLTPGTSPPGGRTFSGLVYDWRRKVLVLFGGRGVTGELSDTWELDTTFTWNDRGNSTPGPHSQFAFAYDPHQGRSLLQGGLAGNLSSDTWSWDGTTWLRLTPRGNPGPRAHHAMIYETTRSRFIAFGGQTLSESKSNDTWTFEMLSSIPQEGCHSGLDGDGDGLTGCADPDCDGFCDPLCATYGMCTDLARSRCGDETCGVLESCRSCSVDCGMCEPLCGDFICDPGEECPGDC